MLQGTHYCSNHTKFLFARMFSVAVDVLDFFWVSFSCLLITCLCGDSKLHFNTYVIGIYGGYGYSLDFVHYFLLEIVLHWYFVCIAFLASPNGSWNTFTADESARCISVACMWCTRHTPLLFGGAHAFTFIMPLQYVYQRTANLICCNGCLAGLGYMTRFLCCVGPVVWLFLLQNYTVNNIMYILQCQMCDLNHLVHLQNLRDVIQCLLRELLCGFPNRW